MRELSLFSGAGGGLLASTLLGWTTVGYVEFNDYCQRVLAQRIRDGHLHNAPIFGDIRAFIGEGYAERYRGVADIVTAGFPCQPFSTAGQRRGGDDDRNMWPATAEVIRLVRPRHVYLENVPGLLAGSHGYFGHVLGELAGLGYDARWGVLGAADVGAPHLRKRLWIVGTAQGAAAHPERHGLREQRERRGEQRDEPGAAEPGDDGDARPVANSDRQRREGKSGQTAGRWPQEDESGTGCQSLADTASGRQPGPGPVEHPPGQRELDGGREEVPDADGIHDDRAGSGAGDVRGERPEASALLGGKVPDSMRIRRNGGSGVQEAAGTTGRDVAEGADAWWAAEPDVGRVAHGVASRVDRLRALGNGQVPIVAATAWRMLTDA